MRTILGSALLSLAAIGAIIAAPLAANLRISVFTELASYQLCTTAALIGACLLVWRDAPASRQTFVARWTVVTVCLTAVVLSWILSDNRFTTQKLKSIPTDVWPLIAADIREVGRQAALGGGEYLPSTMPPSTNIRKLGLAVDYKGGVAAIWDSPEYKGVFAVIRFGYKTRSWGLLLGPEYRAKNYSRGGTCVPVATNAFFYVRLRD